MIFALVTPPLGLPRPSQAQGIVTGQQDEKVIGQEEEKVKLPPGGNFCGSEDMDKYFNGVCGNSVAKIATQCCDENPAPVSCDAYRTACINAHVERGECDSRTDCEAGCRMFNSVAATCCPHVKRGNLTSSERRESLALSADKGGKGGKGGHKPQHGAKKPQHGGKKPHKQKLKGKDGEKPPGVFWDMPDPPEEPAREEYPDDGEEHWDTDGHMHNAPTAMELPEEDFYCGGQASDDYFNDMCGFNTQMGHKLMEKCCPKEDLKIHTPGSGIGTDGERFNPDHVKAPPVCEKYRKVCVSDHVSKGKCADEATCFLGNQSFEQVAISCCTPVSPPPSPPPPKLLCQDYFEFKLWQHDPQHLRLDAVPEV